MNKLEKSLKNWVSHDLINQNQADKIYQFENNQSSHWVLFTLLILGTLIIGLGIISLIAANWNQIPDFIKLLTNFVILILLSVGIIFSFNPGREIQFEILLLFFIVFCLASIGLISQIYNTGGELYQALMLWSLITFPPVLSSRHTFIPWLWYGIFLISSVYTIFNSAYIQSVLAPDLLSIVIFVPLFSAFLLLLTKRFDNVNHFTQALKSWFLMSGLVAVALIDQAQFFEFSLTSRFIFLSYFFTLLVALELGIDKEYNKTQKLILFLTLILFLIAFHLSLLGKLEIIHALFTILILGLIAIFSASLKKRRLFQFLLFCIGLRFLFLFFEAFGGLARTGIGLILSGLLIIFMTFLWNKYRTTLNLWVERWIR